MLTIEEQLRAALAERDKRIAELERELQPSPRDVEKTPSPFFVDLGRAALILGDREG